jgi:hypothetical protein
MELSALFHEAGTTNVVPLNKNTTFTSAGKSPLASISSASTSMRSE